MAAILLTPTPPKAGILSLGFWQEFKDNLATVVSFLSDTTNGTTANTIAELQTGVDTIIAATSDIL